MGGGAQGGGTTVQKTEPWSGVRGDLRRLYAEAENAFKNTSREPFGGELIADPNGMQRGGLNMIANTARAVQPGANALIRLGTDTARGMYLDPGTNPWLRKTMDASIQPVQEQFQQVVLPGITSQAIQQGAYGGNAMDITQNQAAQDYTREIANITGKIGYENYARERALQTQAPQLLQQGQALVQSPGRVLMELGQQRQIWEQDALDEAYQKWQLGQMAPWAGIDQWANVLQGAGGYGTTTQTGPRNSGLGGAISGALGGGALGGLGAYGLLGTTGLGPLAPFLLGGALLGGLAGGLG